MSFNFRLLTRSGGGQAGQKKPLSDSTVYQNTVVQKWRFQRSRSVCFLKSEISGLLTCISVVGNECFLFVSSEQNLYEIQGAESLNYNFVYETFE